MRTAMPHECIGTTADRTVLDARAPLYIAVVCTVDGARFAAAAASEPQCLARVAAYVAEQATEQLWPPSANRIHELLAAGDMPGAIAEYFHRSGERWDAEWLVTSCLGPDPRSAAWSGTVPLPKPLGVSPLPRPSGRGSVAVGQDLRGG